MNLITELLSMNLVVDGVIVPFELECEREEVVERVAVAFLSNIEACQNADDDQDYWRELFFSYKHLQYESKIDGRNHFTNYSFENDSNGNVFVLTISIKIGDDVYTYNMDRHAFLRYLSMANTISPYEIHEEDDFMQFVDKEDEHALNYALYMRNYNLKTTQDSFIIQCYGIKS